MFDAREVTKVYQQGENAVHALQGVNLQIAAGEFVSLTGPSGSGKSTLLHLLSAFDVPTAGVIHFQGRNLQGLSDRERSRLRLTQFGFVFQFFNLLPSLTAAENVALPLRLAGHGDKNARDRARTVLEQVRAGHRARHYPGELSGGEMQRVAVARALVMEPAAILCDEPTGNLDSANGQAILALLRDLPVAGGRSVIMVTHDPQAAQVADRRIHLRDGRVETDEVLRD